MKFMNRLLVVASLFSSMPQALLTSFERAAIENSPQLIPMSSSHPDMINKAYKIYAINEKTEGANGDDDYDTESVSNVGSYDNSPFQEVSRTVINSSTTIESSKIILNNNAPELHLNTAPQNYISLSDRSITQKFQTQNEVKTEFINAIDDYAKIDKKINDNVSKPKNKQNPEEILKLQNIRHEKLTVISDQLENDILDLMDHPELSSTPFFVAENEEDLFINNTKLIDELPYDTYQQLVAAGGELITPEYNLLKSIEVEALRKRKSTEDLVRNVFMQALKKGDLQRVESLIKIDNCLRHQSLLQYRASLKYGPLKTALFDNRLTSLHYAVAGNNPDVINLLIEDNASVVNAKAKPHALDTVISFNNKLYTPTTPLDYAMVMRKANQLSPIDLANTNEIIQILLDAKAQLQSTDPSIQLLINDYIRENTAKPVVQQKTTMYQSMKNLFNPSSSKISPSENDDNIATSSVKIKPTAFSSNSRNSNTVGVM